MQVIDQLVTAQIMIQNCFDNLWQVFNFIVPIEQNCTNSCPEGQLVKMNGQPPLQNLIDLYIHNTDNFFMENYLNSRLYSCKDMKENINGLIIAPPSVTLVPDNKNCPEICPGQLMKLSLVQWKK